MAVHLFLSDRALIDSQQPVVNLNHMGLRCGFLDRTSIEKFVSPTEVNDLRTQRLPILYKEEQSSHLSDEEILQNIFDDILPTAEVHLLNNEDETVSVAQYEAIDFDDVASDVLPTEQVAIDSIHELRLTTDYEKLTLTERTVLEGMSSQERENLFNIIEYLTYGTVGTETDVEINAALLGHTAFEGYVSDTVNVAPRRTIAYIYDLGIHRLIPRQIKFRFAAANNFTDFTIWTDRVEFRHEYPLTTIVNVVPPLELSTLLDPTDISGSNIEISVLSRQTSDEVLVEEMQTRDQSGMMVFPTRYIHHGESYTLPFSIVYRGKMPDSGQVRQHLVDYLVTSGHGTRALWAERFPDLFVVNTYYLIPLWDQTTELTNKDIYPSIIDISVVTNIMNELVTGMDDLIPGQAEILTTAWNHIFTAVVASEDNLIPSLLESHPSYRDFSSTDIGFIELHPDDQAWSLKINQTMAQAAGEANPVSSSLIEVGGVTWVNMITQGNSYNVMTKESYLEARSS